MYALTHAQCHTRRKILTTLLQLVTTMTLILRSSSYHFRSEDEAHTSRELFKVFCLLNVFDDDFAISPVEIVVALYNSACDKECNSPRIKWNFYVRTKIMTEIHLPRHT